jgi:RNA polymerase sigma-32 factor
MQRAAVAAFMNDSSGLMRYLEDIRRFPILEPQQYMLAKRWKEYGRRGAACSRLRLAGKVGV